MPTTKAHRRGTMEEKNRKGRLAGKASSFHGRSIESSAAVNTLHRPRTVPDLLSGRTIVGITTEVRPKLTKLLLNVTVQRSLGPLMMLMPPESTVGNLVEAVLKQYKKEGRRPVLTTSDALGFDLHYSQFCLESLDREEKVATLGSRNFFLCPIVNGVTSSSSSSSSSSCSKEAEKATKTGLPWLKFLL